MDFYTVLKTCYIQGITPFELYSRMCDLCKGDLRLYKKSRVLYELYSNRDVFSEISHCEEMYFKEKSKSCTFINECSKVEQVCLTEVARVIHPDWSLGEVDNESESVLKVKTPKVEGKKEGGVRVAPKQNAFLPSPTPKKPTPKPPQNIAKKTPPKRKQKKISVVKISSLASDLVVKTSATVSDFEVYVLENGVWTLRKNGIGKHADILYINLDGVLADNIQCLIPQEKYSALWLDKVQGNLTVYDDMDCFAKASITLASGELKCKLSCSSVFLSGRVAEISMRYKAKRYGTLDIRNGLGDVKIALQDVGKIEDKIFALHGKIENRYACQTNGHVITLKTVVEYGDVSVG